MTQFDPTEHLIKLKNKDYLPVQFRLVWFRALCPHATIQTEPLHLDFEKGYAVFRATIEDGQGGRATATKMEHQAHFPDYLEKAETGSVGRALAMLGFGTQFVGEELSESERIVDSPVERPSQEKAHATRESLTPSFNQLVEAGILDDSEQGWLKFCKLIIGWLKLAGVKSSQQLLETLTASQVEMVKNHVMAEVQKAA